MPDTLLQMSDAENTLKARAVVAFKRKKYKELYEIISGHNFHSSNHKVKIRNFYDIECFKHDNCQRWSQGHKIRGQGQGHKTIRGQGQGQLF